VNRVPPCRQKGFLLIIVVAILGVLAAMALMLSTSTAMDSALVAKHAERSTLDYLAESGMAHAKWQLAQTTSCSGYMDLPSTAFGDHGYSASIVPNADSPVSIVSTATLENGASMSLSRDSVKVYQASSTITLQPGPEGDDAEIWDQSPNNNYGDSAETWVSSASNDTTRSLLRFNIDAIPPGMTVLDATLSLRRQSGSGSNQPVSAHRIRNQWSEDEVTWDSRESDTNWDTAGGDFENLPIVTTPVGPENKRYEWSLTPLVQDWVDGSHPNYGVALVAAIAGMSGERFYTSDVAQLNRRPSLSVTYACECGMPCGLYGFGKTPVAHWSMDDVSGLVASEFAGGHTGTLDSGPYWTDSGQIDTALQFDGLNDRVIVAHDDALSVADALTISAWIKNDSPDMFGVYRILSKETDGSNDNFWLSVQGGRMWFGVGGQFFTDGSTPTTGMWHHVAATFDASSGEVHMYFDGIETLSQTTIATITANTEPLYIGANWENYKYWNGALDDVRLYDIVLSETDIVEVGKTPALNNGVSVSGIYRDEFKLRNYSGNDGSLNWSTDWLEVNESDGPTSGDERVGSDDLIDYVLRVQDNDGGGEGIQREVVLSSCVSSTLSFDYRRDGLDNSNDYVMVSVSSNGGSSWSEIARFSGPANDLNYQHLSYNLTADMSSTTRLRLLTSPNFGGGDRVYVDHVNISCDK